MKIGQFTIRPDTHCWIVAKVKTRDKKDDDGNVIGTEEYEADRLYPGRYDQALRLCLDLMVRDGIEDSTGLSEAVATVAHLYSTTGRHADAQNALREVV